MEIKARCPYNNIAHEICINKDCIRFNPFICNHVCADSRCLSNHSGCKFMSWNVCKKKMTQAGYKKPENFEDFVEEVSGLYDKLVMMIEQEKSKFIVWSTTLGLNPKIVKFLRDVQNGEFARASGGQISQLLKEGNPVVSNVTVKNLTKIDNLFFRQIDGYMKQILDTIRPIYEKPSIVLYSMKNDLKDQVPKLQKSHLKTDDDFQKNNIKNIINLKSKIQRNELDIRDNFTDGSNLRLLTYIDLQDLTKLVLTDNRLKDIHYFDEMKLTNLKQLYLDYNLIVDITPLGSCSMQNLQTLHLQYNQIQDLSPLITCNFQQLTTLQLNYNQIFSVQPLAFVKFPKLRVLYLYDNNITSLQPFLRFNFPQLQMLHIYGNKFEKQLANFQNKLQTKFKNISFKAKI